MSEVPRPWIGAILVVCGVAAVALGLAQRDRIDLGEAATARGFYVASDGNLGAPSMGIYFNQLVRLLQQEYVDPVEPDLKLADGATRAMIDSLADPYSVFMNVRQFQAYRMRQAGVFEGVGLETKLRYEDPEQLRRFQQRMGTGTVESQSVDLVNLVPNLIVTAVLPGGPSERAGLKVGDRIATVDHRWVVSYDDMQKLRAAQTAAQQGKKLSDEDRAYLTRWRDMDDTNISASRAAALLSTGTKGKIHVEFMRQGKRHEVEIERAKLEIPPVHQLPDGSYSVRFFRGVGARLADVSKDPSKPLVLDLRQSTQGDFASMLRALETFAPPGEYGYLVDRHDDRARPLRVAGAKKELPPLTLRVDASVRGAAEVFAKALQSAGIAKLQGGPMQNEDVWVDSFELPDGSGYTLTTGLYRTSKELRS